MKRVLLLPEGVNEDPYAVLGVTRRSNMSEIKQAFRRVAKQDHPDKNPGDEAAKARYVRASSAYAHIGDPKRRKAFDDLIRELNPPVSEEVLRAKNLQPPKPKAPKRPPRVRKERRVSWDVPNPWENPEWNHKLGSDSLLATLAAEAAMRQGKAGRTEGPMRIELVIDADGVRATRETAESLSELRKAIKAASKVIRPLVDLFR